MKPAVNMLWRSAKIGLLATVPVILGVAAHANEWCPECPDGVHRATGSGYVSRGIYVHRHDPPCADDMHSIARELSEQLSLLVPESIAEVAQGLAETHIDEYLDFVSNNIRGSIGRFLTRRLGTDRSSCRVIPVVLPADAVVEGYAYLASDGDGPLHPCDGDGRACGIGWARFDGGIRIEVHQSHVLAYAVFKNWSHSLDRFAVLRVYYSSASTSRRQVPGTSSGSPGDRLPRGPIELNPRESGSGRR